MQDYRRKDVLTVSLDGEQINVYNWVNLLKRLVVRATTEEEFEPDIGAGDGPYDPEYVTEWLAERLWHEHGIDVEEHGIEVIDVESDEVEVL